MLLSLMTLGCQKQESGSYTGVWNITASDNNETRSGQCYIEQLSNSKLRITYSGFVLGGTVIADYTTGSISVLNQTTQGYVHEAIGGTITENTITFNKYRFTHAGGTFYPRVKLDR